MAQLDTAEGVGEAQKFDEWLKEHKLVKAKSKLKENDVTLEELKELASGCTAKEIKSYGMQTLGLDIIAAQRFAKGVMSLVSNKPQPETQKVVEKIIRIVLSAEEEEAINKIHKQQQEIDEKIKVSTNNINILTKLNKTNQNEANKLRKELMNKLNQRMDTLISMSNEQIDTKKRLISNHIQELNTCNKVLSDADSKIDDLLNDSNINKLKRKTKIKNISDTVLKKKIKDLNVDPKVKIEMSKSIAMQFINGFGKVNNYTYPEKPIISVQDIKKSSATVIFNNFSDKYECLVQLCENYGDDDEKKTDSNWKQITSTKNNKCNITSLESNTIYATRAKYKNKFGFGKMCDPISFKTKKYDIDKHFIYQSDFDTNGICYGIGSNYGQRQWSNPYPDLIKLRASRWTNGKIEHVTGRTDHHSNTGTTGPHNWLVIDFGDKLKIKPAAYTWKHDVSNGTNYALRTWNFEGSNDGNNWRTLKAHVNDTSLNSSYATHTWNIQCNESYQMFRIYMVDKDSSGYWVLACSGFEIYGHLTGRR